MGELNPDARVACPEGWQVSVDRLSVRGDAGLVVGLMAMVQGVGSVSGRGVRMGAGVGGVGMARC